MQTNSRIVTPAEQQIIDALKTRGAIEKLDPNRMDSGVMFLCGDCDRSSDKLTHYAAEIQKIGRNPRLHLVALNGGPLNLVYPHVPDPGGLELLHKFFFGQIQIGLTKNDLGRIILLGHWPCGQAEDVWGMDLESTLDMLAQSAEAARYELGANGANIEIATRLHLDRGEEMNTYHFCPRLWRDWFGRQDAWAV